MMFSRVVIAAAICFVSFVQLGNGYRILGLFPTASISHQVVFRGLTLALNKRGHELVVATTDPINDPTLKNYTEIDMSFFYTMRKKYNHVDDRGKICALEFLERNVNRLHRMVDLFLDNSELRKFYAPDSNEKFDLVIVEMLWAPGLFPMATRFNVPIIGITSLGLNVRSHYVLGNPILPSDHTTWELETRISDQLSFWQRLDNFILVWRHLYWYRTTFMAHQTAIAKKHFGNDIPDLYELEKNVSLIFVNQQGPISYSAPNTPKVIGIGGFHVSKENIVLPKDLQKILDEATQGFVYMSLGSNVKSTMLSNKMMNEFITAFSRLPYKVLWKFEDDVLPGKPDNVHIMKWVPQQAVLAHPNLKVFVYQGGLQSTEEAVAHAVPLVGFPVWADQDMQVSKMSSLGVAIKLEINVVDGDELYKAISTVATDSSYKSRMLNLRSLIEDRPYDLLENAIWWTEHVIRHKGAPHLHSSVADEPWYSRQDMDIVAFLSAASIIFLGLTLVVLYVLVKSIRACTAASLDTQKKTD